MRHLVWLVPLLVTGAALAEPKPTRGVTRIVIDYTYASFHRNEMHYKVEWKGGQYKSGKRVVDAKAIEGLYAALTSLRESDQPLRCISHTDDYPEFTVTVEGETPLVVSSTSNCHRNVPWNITMKGKQFAQFNGDAGRAVDALLAAVDPKTWKSAPDSPEASTMMGGEYVVLDNYVAGKAGTGLASACAKDVESSPRVKQLLGESVVVSELGLVCDLGTSADCGQLVAAAKFVWDGVEAQVELPCSKGTIDTSAATAASIADLKKLLDSKPVRALVRLASKPPRVWENRGWRIETMDLDLPSLDYSPGGKGIEARGIGERGPVGVKFWKELGLDAKKLTKPPRDGFYETTATLDFNGRIVAP